MADTPEAIRKSIRLYLFIGTLLFAFTIITVLVATLEILDFGAHGFDIVDAIIGLGIATFKASCVAAIFMHLNHEKKSIYWVFFGGIFCALCLFGLTDLAERDPIHDPHFYGKEHGKSPAAQATVKVGNEEPEIGTSDKEFDPFADTVAPEKAAQQH
ncbi:MAG: cytochrome C oxidase subunit IV family protein [Verrucomicrobiota bacterium]